MSEFYNFVNGYYDATKCSLWLPVGLGRKCKYLPDISRVELDSMQKYHPIAGYDIDEGMRLGVCIEFEDGPFGLTIRQDSDRNDMFKGTIYISTQMYEDILSIEIPACLTAPFVNHIFGSGLRCFEVWLSDYNEIYYYPAWNGQFKQRDFNLAYRTTEKDGPLVGMDKKYGSTL